MHQALYSYKITFSFQTDAGILNGLKGLSFVAAGAEFAEKYFGYKISVDN